MSDVEYVSITERARQCDLGNSTIWRHIKLGILPPPVSVGSNTTRFIASELAEVDEARVKGLGNDDIRVLVDGIVKRRTHAGTEAASAGVEDGRRLLPTWFTSRMEDCWHYGLLLVTGDVLAVACIQKVTEASDGTIWLDVLLDDCDGPTHLGDKKIIYAPTTRDSASINAAHVVAAVELADT